MRTGVVLFTVLVGLVAAATALIPLAVEQRRVATEPIEPRMTTSLWSMPLSGGRPKLEARLHGQYDFPVAARGGVLLVRPRLLRGGAGIWSLRRGKLTRVGRLPIFAAPEWSPDRKHLVSWYGPPSIEIVDLQGRRVRTITRNHGEGGFSTPSWSGEEIAFTRESRPASGWRLDLEVWHAGGGLAWKRQLPLPQPSVALAPDGRRVALVAVRTLKVVTRRTSRVLATDAAQYSAPTWTPDGRKLVYFDTAGQLVVQEAATGTRRVLVGGRLYDASVSPDGRTVFYLGEKPAVSIPK